MRKVIMLISKHIMKQICKHIITLSPKERVNFLKSLGIDISVQQCHTLAYKTGIIGLIEELSNADEIICNNEIH